MSLPTRPRTLWVLFALTVLQTIAFGVVMKIWDFGIIDEMFNAQEIRTHVGAMTELQRKVHAWMTGTLDIAYPLTYGALYAGLARKGFPSLQWLAFPALICIGADLIEGLSQILILTGHDSWVAVKVIFTPIKLLTFIVAVIIAVAACVQLWRGRKIKAVPPTG